MISLDFETLLKKASTCNNNPKVSCVTEINKHTTCSFSGFVKHSYNYSNNAQCFYKGENYFTKIFNTMSHTSLELLHIKQTKMLQLKIGKSQS